MPRLHLGWVFRWLNSVTRSSREPTGSPWQGGFLLVLDGSDATSHTSSGSGSRMETVEIDRPSPWRCGDGQERPAARLSLSEGARFCQRSTVPGNPFLLISRRTLGR